MLRIILAIGALSCGQLWGTESKKARRPQYGWRELTDDYPLYRDNETDPEDTVTPRGWDVIADEPTLMEDDPDVEERIINGEVTEYGEHPYICSLQEKIDGYWYFICGAIIYDTNTILTAAHCVAGAGPGTLRVICGDYLLRKVDEFEVIKCIVEITVHRGWKSDSSLGFPNDIALLKPDTPFVFNDHINTLPLDDGQIYLTRRCQLVGWGVTERGRLSNVLRDVTIRRLRNRPCRRRWRNLISRKHVCFWNRRNSDSACNGDSGGPAVCGGVLVGMTSWGVSGCVRGYPSVYTRLSRFKTWIENNAF